ncbi:hypothetical protein [Pedobacter gandavensis]|uniref:SbsA Ig-like domain-containing protein n=1 Tax=Pedobacter gandavensis TaxID=2679963 RepID=A0ABR6EV90_9SPHI|nr:hypothetical protein [Pedobacter gandavensis]MBB2149122.1 hypothetical protein [Pedobacter gandavensis]
MKILGTLFIIIFCCSIAATAQQKAPGFITTDIDNFWLAYDKISSSKDSAAQYNYLNQLYLKKGSPGLKAIMEARDYTAKSYIDAINKYPLFWNSVRKNTLKAKDYAKVIATDVARMKKLYPELKPADVYFTIGALRTNGTTLNGKVLIGAELAMADQSMETKEFPSEYRHLKTFFDSNPIQDLGFLNVHEYVHTQQKTTIANNLLAQCTMEGVAEFLAVKATGKPSPSPAIAYGKANEGKIKAAFSLQMFNASNGFWLYNSAKNQFGIRDLGYYVGYAICEKYYEKAINKRLAIKKMIELDYNDSNALAKFVDQSGYFSESVQNMQNEYKRNIPRVIGIKQLKNHTDDVDPSITQLTIEFSTPMNKESRGFDFGPSAGRDKVLSVQNVVGFSEDGRSITIGVALLPGKDYELLLTERFMNTNFSPINPYLIAFRTASK